jgi:hypothetical protein
MVIQKIFIRLGKTPNGAFKSTGDIKQKIEPLWSSSDTKLRHVIPTVNFAIEVDIPDKKFDIEAVAVAKINFELDEERLLVKSVDAI